MITVFFGAWSHMVLLGEGFYARMEQRYGFDK